LGGDDLFHGHARASCPLRALHEVGRLPRSEERVDSAFAAAAHIGRSASAPGVLTARIVAQRPEIVHAREQLLEGKLEGRQEAGVLVIPKHLVWEAVAFHRWRQMRWPATWPLRLKSFRSQVILLSRT